MKTCFLLGQLKGEKIASASTTKTQNPLKFDRSWSPLPQTGYIWIRNHRYYQQLFACPLQLFNCRVCLFCNFQTYEPTGAQYSEVARSHPHGILNVAQLRLLQLYKKIDVLKVFWVVIKNELMFSVLRVVFWYIKDGMV